jgi:NADH dehydrogenase
MSYDTLIVATGAAHSYFGNDSWEQVAPGLKTVEQALDIRRRVFSAFEHAERETDEATRRKWMTFVIVGGGPTGVELAGAVGELAHHTLRADFRAIDTTDARVILVEANSQILPAYPPALADRAVDSLSRLGVTVLTNAKVTGLDRDEVTVDLRQQTETIPSKTVLWAAGVSASPLGRELAEAAGTDHDEQGRIVVRDDLSLPNYPDILVLGDLAHVRDASGNPLPGVAPVAIQQGAYAAKLIQRRLQNKTTRPFRYRDRGNMAVIGRSAAVAEIGRLRFHGFPAWLAWLFVHLIYLVEYENRLLVLIQWAWNYFTRNRSARLITQPEVVQAPADGTPSQQFGDHDACDNERVRLRDSDEPTSRELTSGRHRERLARPVASNRP